MTVAENLAFPLEVRHMDKSEREQRVNRALDMVQLGAFGDRRPCAAFRWTGATCRGCALAGI